MPDAFPNRRKNIFLFLYRNRERFAASCVGAIGRINVRAIKNRRGVMHCHITPAPALGGSDQALLACMTMECAPSEAATLRVSSLTLAAK